MQHQPWLSGRNHPRFEGHSLRCRAARLVFCGSGHSEPFYLGRVLEAHVQFPPCSSSSLPRSRAGRWPVLSSGGVIWLGSREGSAGASPSGVTPGQCLCFPGLGASLCPLQARLESAGCLCQHSSPHLTRLNIPRDLQQIPAEALTNSVNIVFQGNQCSLSQLNGKRLTAQGTSLVSSLE